MHKRCSVSDVETSAQHGYDFRETDESVKIDHHVSTRMNKYFLATPDRVRDSSKVRTNVFLPINLKTVYALEDGTRVFVTQKPDVGNTSTSGTFSI